MKPDPPIQWVTAHQLAVGMTIRCPVDGDRITITELHASSSMIVGIECAKGGCGFNVNDTFELLEPFDLTTVNLDWIKEKLVEEERWFHRNDVLGVAWGTEDAFDKARIEITPCKRIGESMLPIQGSESLVLTEDAFQSFFKALTDDSDDKRAIDNLVTIGELQSDWGSPILTYLMSLQDFSSIIQPLLDPSEGGRINHWKRLGCQWVKIGFRKKFNRNRPVNS
ncbi:hypothetical protein [Vibrio echinoideorum]|uniref:hypothetical protein n=1 Tax=Vibrio echinoideorum TaxID=2100116 RepID=UPI00354CF0AF